MKKIIVPIIIIIGLVVLFWPGYPPSNFIKSLTSRKPTTAIQNQGNQRSSQTPQTHTMPGTLTITVGPGVDKEDEEKMRQGFDAMDVTLNKWFGHSMTKESQIKIEASNRDSKFLVENGKPTFYYRTLSSDWAPIKEFKQMDLRPRAAAHEYVHLYQMSQGCVNPGREGEKALWFIEGSGEWFSYSAMKESGNLPSFFSFMSVEQILVMFTKQFGTAVKSLSNYEESGYGKGTTLGHDPGLYSYLAVAVGFLTKNRDIKTLDDFCVNLGKGQTISVAFQNAFGIPLDKFYSDFEAYFTKTFSISVEKGAGAPPSVDKESQIPQGYASWADFCKVQPKDSRCAAYKR